MPFDLSKQGIIRNAMQICGLLPGGSEPSANQMAMGGDFLNLVIQDIENHGIVLRKLERTTVPLVYAQAQYDLAADTLDVDQGRPYVTGGSPPIDLQLEVISRSMYMELVDKAIISQPTQIYIERGTTISIFLYPTPDTNWTSITLPRVALLDTLDTADSTTGLQAKYLKTIVFGLAHMLALAHPPLLARAKTLEETYASLLEVSTNDDGEKGNTRFVPDYGNGSGW